MTEQRYRAVLEVQAGVPVTEVAERFGVSRQAVHRWRYWYEHEGLEGLADGLHRPHAHPAQTSPEVEAAICELRRTHPRWGSGASRSNWAVPAARAWQLLTDGGRPAGPPPLPAGDPEAGIAVEVDRLVSATGLIGLADRRHPVGSQFAGRRLTVRLDRGLLQLVDQGVLLRSLPNPLTPAEQARLRDARPAGPPPALASESLRVQRRVSCRGALVVAKQRIHVGIVHAGRTLTVEAADTTWRIYDDGGLVAEVARTTTKPVARFKVHKPEPPRERVRAERP